MALGGHKKAAHLAGPESVEQRIWTTIRQLGAEGSRISRPDIAFVSKAAERAISDYVQRLLLGGYLKADQVRPRDRLCNKEFAYVTYKLTRDVGATAPRLKRDGTLKRESNRERMWRALRILRSCSALDLQLSVNAAGGGPELPYLTAKTYLLQLRQAGYLAVAQAGRSGQGKAGSVFRLVPSMNTGPRSPIKQKGGAVYDPNKGEVAWQPK